MEALGENKDVFRKDDHAEIAISETEIPRREKSPGEKIIASRGELRSPYPIGARKEGC